MHPVGVSDFVKERLLAIRGDLRIFKDLRPEFTGDDLIFHWGNGPGSGVTVSHWVACYRCFLPDLAGFAGSNCTAPQT